MSRKFNETDIKIFNKLAPELNGNIISNMGHQYLFILRPISHKVAESAEDFKRRVNLLTDDELTYLLELALTGIEDIRSLEEEDIDSFIEIIAERISLDKSRELKSYIGIV